MKLCGRRNVGYDLRVVDRDVSVAAQHMAKDKLECRLITVLRLFNLLCHNRLHVTWRDRVVTRLLQRRLPIQNRGLRRQLILDIR